VSYVFAFVVGYLIGSIPSAIWISRMWGVDLMAGGTGNPGANNAMRLGGSGLAVAVLVVEVLKGLTSVLAGYALGGDVGGVTAGLGAVIGNVYNVWLGFNGGKGLSIGGGVILGVWPLAFPFAVMLLIGSSAATRSSGRGALITLGSLVVGAALWSIGDMPVAWGVEDDRLLVPAMLGLGLILVRKHWRDAVHPLSAHDHR
jgi:glycerol-3-phosphate acyltransferase PlsY